VSYILNIDTAVTSASVCLARDAQSLGVKINPSQKDHAAWLHVAIKELVEEAGLSLTQLDAVGISAGPGSYTGLRVGMSAAKGLCYALQKPLITISTLQMMAVAAKDDSNALWCPMIDARRMEVFTAVYNSALQEILSPINLILTADSFSSLLDQHRIIFFGNGSTKFQAITHHSNAYFKNAEASAEHMNELVFNKLQQKLFADLAYVEPYYGKEFYTPSVKPSL
jgi:tRNA threonylcarbamoyladenosine biosynthesis protein TsaB